MEQDNVHSASTVTDQQHPKPHTPNPTPRPHTPKPPEQGADVFDFGAEALTAPYTLSPTPQTPPP